MQHRTRLRSKLFSFLWIICFACSFFTSFSHDGITKPIPAKSNVPVSYYQAIMLAIAGCYGIYLLIRAKKRKNADKA